MHTNFFNLDDLIRQTYSEEEAVKQAVYRATEADIKEITDAGRYILSQFPSIPNCCAPMSALWAAIIRDRTSIPTHLVAGNLYLQGRCIFGDDIQENNIVSPFSLSNSQWDGHCWVSFGNVLGDISFFRTAYAATTPNWLREMVFELFGEGRGLICGEPVYLQRLGLEYQPKNIATDDQITSVVRGAIQVIQHGKMDFEGSGIS